MTSDGYQTFNFQDRKAFSAKYQYAISPNVQLTAFSSVVDLHSNTPDQKGSTRAQLQQFGNNFLLTDDPTSPLYYKFNFYHIPTNFEYVGVEGQSRSRLVDRQQDVHDAVLQQAELQQHDGDHRDERDRQAEQLLEGGQHHSGDARVRAWRLPNRTVVRIRVDRSLPDAVRSAHLGRCRAAELPREVPHDDDAAVCGVRAAGRAEAADHTGREAGVLQAGLHAVCRQRQDRRQSQWRAVHQARRRVPHLAAVDRCALSGAIRLVAVRTVRKGPEHSADAAFST